MGGGGALISKVLENIILASFDLLFTSVTLFFWLFWLLLNLWLYSKNYDLVPLPFRYRYSVTVIDRQPPLPTITDRYGLSPNVTERYKSYQALPNITQGYPALRNVTERYIR